MTMWNYSIQTSSPVTQPASIAEVAPAVDTPRYTPEQTNLLQSLLGREENRTIAEGILRDVTNAGLGANDSGRVLDMINNAFGNPVRVGQPIGNDAMVASARTLDVAYAQDGQRFLEENNRSSTTDRDNELLASRVENRVKELMAQGRPLDEILREVGNLAATPAQAQLASAQAEQQYNANRNPFEAPNAPAANTPAPSVASNVLGAGFVGAVLGSTAQPLDLSVPAASLQFANMGTSIGAFLDHIENAGPTNVPDVRAAMGIARDTGGRNFG